MKSSSVFLLYVEFPLHPESLRVFFSFQPGNPSLPHTTSPDGYFDFNSKMQSPQPLPNTLLCSMQKIPGLVCSGEELHHLQHPQREEELTDPASKAKSDTPSGSHQLCTSFTDVLQQAWEKKNTEARRKLP